MIRAAVVEGILFEAMAANPAPGTFFGVTATLYLTIPVYGQLGPLWAVSNIAWLAIIASAVGSLVVRYRRGGDAERRQLLWLVLAMLVVVAYVGIPWGIFNTGPILGLLVIPLIPVAITIAILRLQLLDIRLVVSRALVYGILTAAAAGAYVGVVALLEAIFGPGIARRVLGLVSAPPAAGVPFPELTGREREVLDLIAAGTRNAEIARRMSIAPKTVANHVSAIFAKLQVTDRGEAIIAARDAGLGRGAS